MSNVETQGVVIVDVKKHVWCPRCRRQPGAPCSVTKHETNRILAAIADNTLTEVRGLHVDDDGVTEVHPARSRRADALVDGTATWRREELMSLMKLWTLVRAGRAS